MCTHYQNFLTLPHSHYIVSLGRNSQNTTMKIVYAGQTTNFDSPGIFLAGPSPRSIEHPNWRPQAIQILKSLQFEGEVYIPLTSESGWIDSYEEQIEWELKHLQSATVIVFWIPRDLRQLPGFTTNVEYGMFLKHNIVLGYPTDAVRMEYLDYLAKKNKVPIFHTLRETLQRAVFRTE